MKFQSFPLMHAFNYDKLTWDVTILPKVESECYKTAIVNKMLMVIGGIKSYQNTNHVTSNKLQMTKFLFKLFNPSYFIKAYLIHMGTGSIMQISSLNHKRSEMGVVVIDTKGIKNVYAIGGWRTINDMKNTYREAERFSF